jgi:hypothetical protein
VLYDRGEGLGQVAKSKAPPDWRGQDWTDRLPLWHKDHPIRKVIGGTNEHRVDYDIDGTTIEFYVEVPALGDEPLEQIIASFAAVEKIDKLPRITPIAALESIACFYDYEYDPEHNIWLNADQPGTGTPEKMQALYDRLGIKPHGLVTSIFQPLLKLVCGNAADGSGWVSRRAGALSYWASLPPDKRPYPIGDNQIAGSSPFAEWLMSPEVGGIDKAAEKWRELRQPEPEPEIGDVRVTGYAVSTIIRGDKPALAADDPAAKSWNVDWFIQANCAQEPAWFTVYINCTSLADAQSAAAGLKAHGLLVKSLLVKPTPGDRRVVGVWNPGNLYQGVAVTPNYHAAKKWQAQRAGVSSVWLSLPVGPRNTDYDSLTEAEAALAADAAKGEGEEESSAEESSPATVSVRSQAGATNVPSEHPQDRSDATTRRETYSQSVGQPQPEDPIVAVLRSVFPKIYKPASDYAANAYRVEARKRLETEQRAKLASAVWRESLKTIVETQEPETIAKAIINLPPSPDGVSPPAIDIMKAIFDECFSQYGSLYDLLDEIDAVNKTPFGFKGSAATALAEPQGSASDQTKPRSWITPPDLLKWLNENYGPLDFDAAPYPRPEGFDALTVPWGKRTYANGPFSARKSPDGVGPADYARKAIEENKLEKRIVMPLPGRSYEDELLRAGAEVVPLGQVAWQDAATGEPQSSPPFTALYVLWETPEQTPAGLRKRVAELESENAELKARIAELETLADPNIIQLKR